ncbi:ATP-dependent RNA helicase ddx42 [Entomortierella beljakovae]|nr:ATP-dependent RNA helicase ddx42 [Entomortierella beljakovae]
MSNGKRTINISLGGSSAPGSKPNPFARSTRPSSTKSALGFQDDEDEDDNLSSLGHKQKQIKLDHDNATDDISRKSNTESDDEDAFSKLSASETIEQNPPPRKSIFGGDDEDEDDAFSLIASKKGREPVKKDEMKKVEEEEEEDDPLDAFMAGIDTKVKEEAEKPSEEKVRRDDIEDEDYVESYMKHMKKKGITIGQGGPVTERNEDVDSDEEVYATARAIDNAAEAQFDPDDVSWDPQAKKEITPLPRVDHSKQDYIEIEKCFYEEHGDIAKLGDDQVRQIRIDLDMRVSGANVAKPCISFAHFGFEEALMETIRRAGYTEPSGIQRQAIPVALSGRDIIGIAKTGSGKTAAFLLPMIVHIMDQEELDKGDGPIGVVLAPTRELADQIYSEAKRFAKAYGIRVAVVYGGASKHDQFKTLRSGVEIIVATPGRLIDMIKMKATNFRRTSYLVLDEADRVFDLGFEPQVRSICDNIRPDRQTLLFSATFQKRVEKLAREVMTDPVRISIGNVGQINTDVTQVIQILKEDTLKFGWLTERLHSLESGECLHGDMLQHERDKAIHDYKNRTFPTLIATDVAARGLDIKSIKNVVNYDVARDIDSHVHRVGRTGRAGEKGTAYTLITEKDDRFAGELVRNLEESSQAVSAELLKIAMQNPRFRKSRQFMSGRGGRGGRGSRGERGGRGGRGRGGGRGGGRPHTSNYSDDQSFSTAANNTPLGQNDRRQQNSHSGGSVGGGGRDHGSGESTGSGYRVSGFQKASRPETGAFESIPSRSQASQSHQATTHQRPPPGYGFPPQNRPPHPQHSHHPNPQAWPPGPPPPGFPRPPPHGGFNNQSHPPYPPPPHYRPPPPHGQQSNARPPSGPYNSNNNSDRKRRWDK